MSKEREGELRKRHDRPAKGECESCELLAEIDRLRIILGFDAEDLEAARVEIERLRAELTRIAEKPILLTDGHEMAVWMRIVAREALEQK